MTWLDTGSFLVPALCYFRKHSLPCRCLFETISGLTTTVLPGGDIEILPEVFCLALLYNWIGGMGILVFTVAILPTMGIGVPNI